MKKLQLASFLLVTLAQFASAGALFYSRGLPGAYNGQPVGPSYVGVNDIAGANRSNISWINQDQYYATGDSFITPNASNGAWAADSLSVWVVMENLVDDPSVYGTFSLFLGPSNDPNSLALVSNITSFSREYYSPAGSLDACAGVSGSDYQTPSGCVGIYKVTFALNNLLLVPGSEYDFAVQATQPGCTPGTFAGCLALHATNAANALALQQGSNNEYLLFDFFGGAPPLRYVIDSNGFGWDKSSDVNVMLTGFNVPEPSTYALMGLGLAALAALRRRK